MRPYYSQSQATIYASLSKRSKARMNCLVSESEQNPNFVCCDPVSMRSTG